MQRRRVRAGIRRGIIRTKQRPVNGSSFNILGALATLVRYPASVVKVVYIYQFFILYPVLSAWGEGRSYSKETRLDLTLQLRKLFLHPV